MTHCRAPTSITTAVTLVSVVPARLADQLLALGLASRMAEPATIAETSRNHASVRSQVLLTNPDSD